MMTYLEICFVHRFAIESLLLCIYWFHDNVGNLTVRAITPIRIQLMTLVI